MKDTDCPFFKPDAFPDEENYGCDRIVPIQNDKGEITGIEKGYCSMPQGKIPISYRKYFQTLKVTITIRYINFGQVTGIDRIFQSKFTLNARNSSSDPKNTKKTNT